VQACGKANPVNGTYQGMVYAFMDNCYCLGNITTALTTASIGAVNTNAATTLIGNCALYNTSLMANYACQNVVYSSAGCTGKLLLFLY